MIKSPHYKSSTKSGKIACMPMASCGHCVCRLRPCELPCRLWYKSRPRPPGFQNMVKRGAGRPTPHARVSSCHPGMIVCCFNLPRSAHDRDQCGLTRALEQKKKGRLVLIYSLTCMKGLNHSPPLIPLPCRSNTEGDNFGAISRRGNAPFVRPGAGKDKAKGSCADDWLWARAQEKALLKQECAAVSGELKSSSCSQVARMAAVRHRPEKSGCL